MSARGRLETLREWARRAWGTFRGNPSEQERRARARVSSRDGGGGAAPPGPLGARGGAPRAAAFRHGAASAGRLERAARRAVARAFLARRQARGAQAAQVLGPHRDRRARDDDRDRDRRRWFSFVRAFSGGALPLDEGDRVVAIQTWSQAQGRSHRHNSGRLRALARRASLGRRRGRVSNGEASTSRFSGDAPSPDSEASNIVNVAEMSAAGFGLARVPPLRGRPLVEADERADAEPVVVIGYDVWRARFSADPEIVGRRVRLDDTVHTVVGVMPEGFAFPINHQYWIPLRAESPARAWERRTGDLRFRPACAGGDARKRASGARDARPRATCDAARRDGSRTASTRASGPTRKRLFTSQTVRPHLAALDAVARSALREHRDPRVRADRRTARGIRDTCRARREPRPNRRPTLPRDAPAVGRGGVCGATVGSIHADAASDRRQ